MIGFSASRGLLGGPRRSEEVSGLGFWLVSASIWLGLVLLWLIGWLIVLLMAYCDLA